MTDLKEEEETFKKVRRGFSVSQGNERLVSEARSNIFDKIEEKSENQAPYFKDSSNSTFLLPNLSLHPFKFRAYLEKNLIEQSALLHLENMGRLNWWCDNNCMQRLWPLATTGDGNCLLHAASLAMWGFHDRHLTLRHVLHHRLIHDNMTFYRRWVYQSLCDEQSQGFTRSKEEFEEEWHQVCSLSLPVPKGSSSTQVSENLNDKVDNKYLICCNENSNEEILSSDKKQQGTSPKVLKNHLINKSYPYEKHNLKKPLSINNRNSFYDFLEQIHVFVLAQILRRPIIILSDSYVRDVDGKPLQPLLFGGLYLPLLEKPENCDKSPLLLAYNNSHFSALVPMDYSNDPDCTSHLKLPLAVPLVDPHTNQQLVVHFAVDPGEDWMKQMDLKKVSKHKQPDICQLLQSYMHCEEFKYCPDHKRTSKTHLEITADASSNESIVGVEHQKNSLSRSIGKQIKEKFSVASKSKSNNKSDPNSNCNSNTNANKITKGFWSQFEQGGLLLGANLKITLPPKYKEMIANYLKEAENNFSDIRDKCRRASVELMTKVQANSPDKKLLASSNSCIDNLSGGGGTNSGNNATNSMSSSQHPNDFTGEFMDGVDQVFECASTINTPTNNKSGQKCFVSNCNSESTCENYCDKCYAMLPNCKSPECQLRATKDHNYCIKCHSKILRNI